jgi:predicted DsbA family dithiol-disulfide isomerase
MRIEIWSDVACPWCYIGKRRLETALADFPHDVEVIWRAYQLDPGAPEVPVETVAESLARKYGGGLENARRMIERVQAIAAEEGMVWRHHESQRASTIDAHRLLHLALVEQGSEVQGRLKEALLASYFIHAENPADHDVLRKAAAEAGLDAGRVDEVLATTEYLDEVFTDIEQAGRFGATGVPFFVVDRRYGISGAQSADVFRQVLERAWADTHPALELVDGDADACGPDGCAI